VLLGTLAVIEATKRLGRSKVVSHSRIVEWSTLAIEVVEATTATVASTASTLSAEFTTVELVEASGVSRLRAGIKATVIGAGRSLGVDS
jgi:hypothetical protein